MSTRRVWKQSEIKTNPLFSKMRSTIETAFYGNNVTPVTSVAQAYQLAAEEPGVIVLDMPVYKPCEQGLPTDAKVLVTNDGKTTGRYAKARRIIGDEGIDEVELSNIARDAVYDSRDKEWLAAEAIVGLDKKFTARAHLMIPKDHASTLYSWIMNFKFFDAAVKEFYDDSLEIPEGDIYIYSDPDYIVPGHPGGLAIFDPAHNCAMILGMRYFGEHKKGTLTLAWSLANRLGYVACHGGMKRYNLDNGKSYTIGVFGLSGSGKSTLTHEKHDGRYDISILHDDAYIINTEDLSSIALEPTYFDKMQDYPVEHPANEFLLTLQNVGVTMDDEGRKVVLAEDVRNNNGRAIKSQFWTENRVNYVDEPVNAIVWLMKDKTLPPILKIDDPVLASTMGATLATRRSTAEKLDAHVDPNALVIEPYANPFRTYPLALDYESYKKLFSECGVECYIMNTGFFLDNKVPKEVTLDLLERLVEGTLEFKPFYKYPNLEYVEVPGFEPPFQVREYHHQLHKAFEFRYDYVENLIGHKNELPEEVLEVLKTLM
ncbi:MULTISPECIES: phosphoenolpyruvate carboxykinase (ATP) [Veillonella]|uniref:phosphoenolpyruvate carboxykinase (ATP) n=1 Tax=Veillonella rogosae TaxID=423477 RepID=A0AA46X5F9_9FIRM|nr:MULTISPECIES: phosphoenolpyruvate carboxykinase (ATP) [Veillonella]EFR60128.1 putative phosphoenolpyruvate carboxykinase (ATP) [Veillonella sp. oral taxon 158 str. F0412]MDU1130168.1 phosphoenolpyruvate carboxykinase (ATP) [Veillonella sp.]MDU3564668.1 phosphoenolpyruvate carboxykinase (ATP) [Veillonella sp.]MDU3630843.1 phosphoenolpyruvate carboxykinase (ATP) [Veillonella sp.]UZG51236.1 phosphoenolpyruvate carboxykinase (ATP) [Veillonella rogosae]